MIDVFLSKGCRRVHSIIVHLLRWVCAFTWAFFMLFRVSLVLSCSINEPCVDVR